MFSFTYHCLISARILADWVTPVSTYWQFFLNNSLTLILEDNNVVVHKPLFFAFAIISINAGCNATIFVPLSISSNTDSIRIVCSDLAGLAGLKSI